MDAQAVLTITAVVVTIVQVLKASPLPTTGVIPLLLVVVLSGLAVLVWGVSYEPAFGRALIWNYFAAWVNITLAAAGAYGIVRTAAEKVMAVHP